MFARFNTVRIKHLLDHRPVKLTLAVTAAGWGLLVLKQILDEMHEEVDVIEERKADLDERVRVRLDQLEQLDHLEERLAADAQKEAVFSDPFNSPVAVSR